MPPSFFLFLLYCFLAATTSFADPNPAPKNDTEIVERLIGFQRRAPTLLSQSVDFDIDLFKLYREYALLLGQLRMSSTYRDAWQKRLEKPYWDLRITPAADTAPTFIRILSNEAFEQMRTDLQTVITNAKTSGSLENWRKSFLKVSLIKKTGPRNSEQALVSALPPDQRRQILGNTKDKEVTKRLVEYWTRNLESAKKTPGVMEALQNIQAPEQTETPDRLKQTDFLLFAFSLAHPEATHWDKLEKEAAVSSKPDLERLFDVKDFVLPRVRATNHNSYFEKRVDQTLRTYFNELKNKHGSITQNVRPEYIRVLEVGPEMGMLRGVIPSNCATESSAFTSLDPEERIFYLLDKDDKPIGYLQSTITAGEKEIRGQYFSSGDGQTLRAGQLLSALEGLKRKKSLFDVHEHIVPKDVSNQHLVNHSDLAAVFNAFRGQSQKKIQFHQPQLRERVVDFKGEYNKGSYDKISEHTEGFLIPEASLGSKINLDISVRQATEPDITPVPSNQITLQEILRLAISLRAGHHDDSLESLKKYISKNHKALSLEDLEAFLDAWDNPKSLSLKAYRKDTNKWLKKLPLTPSERDALWKLADDLLGFEGSAEAPDGFSEENFDEQVRRYAPAIKEALLAQNTPAGLDTAFHGYPIKALAHNFIQGVVSEILSDDTDVGRAVNTVELLDLPKTHPKAFNTLIEGIHSRFLNGGENLEGPASSDLLKIAKKYPEEKIFTPAVVKKLEELALKHSSQPIGMNAIQALGLAADPGIKSVLELPKMGEVITQNFGQQGILAYALLSSVYSQNPSRDDLTTLIRTEMGMPEKKNIVRPVFTALISRGPLPDNWKKDFIETLKSPTPSPHYTASVLEALTLFADRENGQEFLRDPELRSALFEFRPFSYTWSQAVAAAIETETINENTLNHLFEAFETLQGVISPNTGRLTVALYTRFPKNPILKRQLLQAMQGNSYIERQITILESLNRAIKKNPKNLNLRSPEILASFKNLLSNYKQEVQSNTPADLLNKAQLELLKTLFLVSPNSSSIKNLFSEAIHQNIDLGLALISKSFIGPISDKRDAGCWNYLRWLRNLKSPEPDPNP